MQIVINDADSIQGPIRKAQLEPCPHTYLDDISTYPFVFAPTGELYPSVGFKGYSLNDSVYVLRVESATDTNIFVSQKGANLRGTQKQYCKYKITIHESLHGLCPEYCLTIPCTS